MITTTFTWPSGAEKTPPLKLTMSRSALEERDPDGTSLVSAKMRFVGQTEFEMDASGPGEDEYMTPELIRFVWAYMADGSLDVTPGLEGDDAERCATCVHPKHSQVATDPWLSVSQRAGVLRLQRRAGHDPGRGPALRRQAHRVFDALPDDGTPPFPRAASTC